MKNEMPEHIPGMPHSNSRRYGGHGGYKKKGGTQNIVPTNDNYYFRGLGFKMGRVGQNLYEKPSSIYSSTQFKNGSDVMVCLRSEEYVNPEVTVLPDEPTANDQRLWEYKMNNHLKSGRVLKNNLHNLYTVIIALCDTEVKSQVKSLPNYKEWDKKIDAMSVLKEIKKIVYMGGSNSRHTKYNKAMALMNLMDI